MKSEEFLYLDSHSHFFNLFRAKLSGVSAPRQRGCSPPIDGGDMEGVISLLNREGCKDH